MRPVRVLDGKEDDMPQCILTTASMDGAPAYCTLPYTWGSLSIEATKRCRRGTMLPDSLQWTITSYNAEFIRLPERAATVSPPGCSGLRKHVSISWFYGFANPSDWMPSWKRWEAILVNQWQTSFYFQSICWYVNGGSFRCCNQLS